MISEDSTAILTKSFGGDACSWQEVDLDDLDNPLSTHGFYKMSTYPGYIRDL